MSILLAMHYKPFLIFNVHTVSEQIDVKREGKNCFFFFNIRSDGCCDFSIEQRM